MNQQINKYIDKKMTANEMTSFELFYFKIILFLKNNIVHSMHL